MFRERPQHFVIATLAVPFVLDGERLRGTLERAFCERPVRAPAGQPTDAGALADGQCFALAVPDHDAHPAAPGR